MAELFKDLINQIAAICDEKKATDIRSYTVENNAYTADSFVVVSAQNDIHAKALVADLDDQIGGYLIDHPHSDFYDRPKMLGTADSGWIIIDLNAVIIHCMTPEIREFYEIDALFEKRGIVYHH